MRTKFFTLFCIVLVAGLLAACAIPPATPLPGEATEASAPTEKPTEEATDAPTVEAAPEPVELSILWWGSDKRHEITQQVLNMYTAENPHVTFAPEYSSWSDYWTVSNTKAAGGELPCIMQQDYAYLNEWTSRELLMSLNEFIDSGTLDMSDVPADFLAGGTIDGNVYAIPLGVNAQAFIIEKNVFGEAGLDIPQPDWTWDDFEVLAGEIKDKTGIWAQGADLPAEAMWKSLYLAYGEWAFNEDGTALGYENDEPLIAYMKMIKRLQEIGALPTAEEGTEYSGAGPEASPLVLGKAAMDYRWSNQVVAVVNAAGKGREFVLVPLPRPVDGKQPSVYIKPASFFAITSTCKAPEEAARFISYFTNSLEANEVLAAERGVPIAAQVRDGLKEKMDPVTGMTFDFIALVQEDASPLPPPDPAGWGDIRTNVWTPIFVDPVLYGQITIEEGVKVLRREADAILAQNKR
ncbi:MAG: extracellular solute-binding protein [Anaerolineae bacterium]|nr:extracellular solute-binding protein [Anaerolineae bacterium]